MLQKLIENNMDKEIIGFVISQIVIVDVIEFNYALRNNIRTISSTKPLKVFSCIIIV